jgi:hypothetical protein
MGESPGTTRTNISISRDLKKRMDAVKVPVNWSAVAAQAFAKKLKELESQKEVKGMHDVIARLRASQQLESNEDYQTGRKAGEEWAREKATTRELRRLKKFSSEFDCRDWNWSPPMWGGDTCGIAHYILVEMDPKCEGDRVASEGFWEEALDEQYPEGDLLRGFCDGALEVWDQVKDKL